MLEDAQRELMEAYKDRILAQLKVNETGNELKRLHMELARLEARQAELEGNLPPGVSKDEFEMQLRETLWAEHEKYLREMDENSAG